jgi:hypothetical protein
MLRVDLLAALLLPLLLVLLPLRLVPIPVVQFGSLLHFVASPELSLLMDAFLVTA